MKRKKPSKGRRSLLLKIMKMLMRAKTSPRKKSERHLFGYYEDESDNYLDDETREVISHVPSA